MLLGCLWEVAPPCIVTVGTWHVQGACDTHLKAFKGAYKLAEAHANAAGDTKTALRCNRMLNRIQECRNSNERLAGKKLDLSTLISLFMSQAVPLLEEHFDMDNTMDNMKGAKMKEVMNDVWSSIRNEMEQCREKEMSLDEAYQRWWQKAKAGIQKALREESKALGKLPGASGHVPKRLFPGGRDAYVRAPPQKLPRMHGALAAAQKKMEFCPFLRKGTCLKGDKCDWSHGQADGAK
jgi:hypothetical protein